jgi:hypothetical protein
MKKVFALLACSVCMFISAYSQTATDSIKNSIENLFTAMKNSDTALLKKCFADSAVMQTIVRDRAGNNSVRTETVSEFARAVVSMVKGAADERITFDFVKIDGPLASVWTPYKFYFNGQFSHCGVNSFQMVRERGIWKIQYIIDTRRRQGCE